MFLNQHSSKASLKHFGNMDYQYIFFKSSVLSYFAQIQTLYCTGFSFAIPEIAKSIAEYISFISFWFNIASLKIDDSTIE